MNQIQGRRGISLAGTWLRYGFHEDGLTSGLRAVADYIPDVDQPFPIEYPVQGCSRYRIGSEETI